METGDGLLVRLPRSERPQPLFNIRAIAAAAKVFGNGIVEVTSRGAIQLRGLRPDTAPRFAEIMLDLDLPPDDRPALISGPLAGLDPCEADVRPLVAALRVAIADSHLASRLAPKVATVVDGGGTLHLDGVSADVRLRATGAAAFHLSLAGTAADAVDIGLVRSADAIPAMLVLLSMIADAGPRARASELVRMMHPTAIRDALSPYLTVASPPAPRPPAEPIGLHRLSDGSVAAGVGIAFGQTDSASLEELVAAADHGGAAAFAPTEGRVLLAISLAPDRAPAFLAAAGRIGFITRPDDPRRSVFACPGEPACAMGLMPARAVAAAATVAALPILDGSIALHISGCAKGCSHPGPADLTFVGTGDGDVRLVVGGGAGDGLREPGDSSPSGAAAIPLPTGERGCEPCTLQPRSLPARIARLASALAGERRRGEPTADLLARLGAGRIAALFSHELVDG